MIEQQEKTYGEGTKLSQGMRMMICPCCGEEREESVERGATCGHCGARQVGEPLTQPDQLLPKLGPALIAFGVAIAVLGIFLAAWVLGNDLRVGRVFLVTLLGDGWKTTRLMLAADPRLPYYRIIQYDATRLAFVLSAVLIPLSVLGIWLARRAERLAEATPHLFSGRRLAKASLALCGVWLASLTTVIAFSVPERVEGFRERRRAETRAVMYQLHQQALQKYYQEYGSYPQELPDLSRVNAESTPRADYWEQPFTYQPVGVIASNGASIIFSNYKLVSAGADGRFATEDDLVMIDGIILEGSSKSDPNRLAMEDLFPSN